MGTRTIANLTAVISANNTKFNKGINGATKTMKGFSKNVNSIGKSIVPFIGITAGVTAMTRVLKNAGSIVMDFEQAMADVKSITLATDKEFDKLKSSAKELGSITKFTASEVAGLQKEYAKLGFTTEEIINASEATLDLAAATGTELARAAEVAGVTLKGFDLDAKETKRITDIMADSFTSSALDMEKFAESMKFVAPIAKITGTSIEETAAMLSVLADAGISGSMAGTSLRKIFSELSDDGSKLSDKLKKLSQEGITLASAQDEVGARAKTALLVINDQIDRIPELTKAYEDSGGAAKRMAEIQLNTLKGQFEILKSSYQGFILELTNSDEAMDKTKGFISSISEELQRATRRIKGEETAFEELEDSLISVQTPLGKHLDKIEEFISNLSGSGGAIVNQENWNKSINEFGVVTFSVLPAMKSYNEELAEQNENLSEQDEKAKATAEALQKYKDGLALVGEEMEEVNKAMVLMNLRGTKLEDTISTDAFIKMAGNLSDLKREVDKGTFSLDDFFEELEDGEEQVNEIQLEKLLDKFRQMQEGAKRMALDIETAFTGVAESFAVSLGQVAAGAKSFGETIQEIVALIFSALGEILIYAGLNTLPEGIGLLLAGLALKGFSSFAMSDMRQNQQLPSYNVPQGDSMLYGNDIRLANNYSTNLYDRVG
jgi:hypothetical protein